MKEKTWCRLWGIRRQAIIRRVLAPKGAWSPKWGPKSLVHSCKSSGTFRGAERSFASETQLNPEGGLLVPWILRSEWAQREPETSAQVRSPSTAPNLPSQDYRAAPVTPHPGRLSSKTNKDHSLSPHNVLTPAGSVLRSIITEVFKTYKNLMGGSNTDLVTRVQGSDRSLKGGATSTLKTSTCITSAWGRRNIHLCNLSQNFEGEDLFGCGENFECLWSCGLSVPLDPPLDLERECRTIGCIPRLYVDCSRGVCGSWRPRLLWEQRRVRARCLGWSQRCVAWLPRPGDCVVNSIRTV